MGREAACLCRWGVDKGEVKALLESHELILRGEIKRKVALTDLKNVKVDGAICVSRLGGSPSHCALARKMRLAGPRRSQRRRRPCGTNLASRTSRRPLPSGRSKIQRSPPRSKARRRRRALKPRSRWPLSKMRRTLRRRFAPARRRCRSGSFTGRARLRPTANHRFAWLCAPKASLTQR